MTTLPVSPAYRPAVVTAVALQLPATLFLMTLLDDGTAAKIGGAAMVGFWAGVAIIMLRRPRDPSQQDLQFVRWGYLVAFMVGIACAPLLGVLRR